MRMACGSTTYHIRWKPGQGQRVGRLALAPRHGLDRSAHDLGDVARRVDDEREQGAEVGRRHRDAAGRRGARRARERSRRGRRAARRRPSRRRVIGNAQRNGAGRPPRAVGDAAPPPAHAPQRQHAEDEDRATGFQFWPSYQNTLAPRTLITASGPSSHESSGGGKAFCTMAMKARIDERQQRHVADDLDVALRRAAHDEVLRQPGDADERAEHGGQHDAGDRQAQRVEEALDDGVARRSASWRNVLDGIGKPAGWSR